MLIRPRALRTRRSKSTASNICSSLLRSFFIIMIAKLTDRCVALPMFPSLNKGLNASSLMLQVTNHRIDYAKPWGRRISSKHDHALNFDGDSNRVDPGCLFSLNIYLNWDLPFDDVKIQIIFQTTA